MSERHCIDCQAPVSVRSTGRCRRCANAINNRAPSRIAKAAAAYRKLMADPAGRARHAAACREAMARNMQDPAFVEAKREAGRRYGAPNLVRGQSPEARAKNGRAVSATRLAHIPEAYRPLYRALRDQGMSAAERTEYVRRQIAEEGAWEVRRNAEAMRLKHEREKASRY